jgi:DNA repair protein RecO
MKPYGEGNAVVTIMTKDLGLIRAIAQGIRLAKSKLRMSIQECSLSQVSLVKGKDMWRLTNTVHATLFYPLLKKKASTTAFNVQALIERLTPADEPHAAIYEVIVGLWKRLSEINPPFYKALECIALLNVLHELGYLGEELKWQEFIGVYEPDIIALATMDEVLQEAIYTINASLLATHL